MSRIGFVPVLFGMVILGVLYGLLLLVGLVLKALGLAFLLVLVYCILTLVGIVPPIDLPLIP